MRPSAIIIGIAAGLTAALLFAGVVLQSTLAVVLSLVSPLPILIASLGWGSAVGFIAAASAGIALAAFTGTVSSGLLLGAIALPAAVIGHVAGLARPRAEAIAGGDGLDWFPVPRIILTLTVAAAAACLFVGWLVGYDANVVGDELSRALTEQVGGSASPEQVDRLAHQVVGLVPFIQPALLVLVLSLSLYLAAAVTRLSGKLARPRDDVPSTAGVLPRIALPIFAGGLALSFVSGTPGDIGAVVAGSFGMAFTLAGIAAIHRMTRATRSRGLILFAFYMAVMILTFPLFVATIIGLSETTRRPAVPTT